MTRHPVDTRRRFSFAKHENTARGQAEKDRIDRDDVVENSFVSSGESNNDRQQSLQSNRYDRRTRLWMDHAYAFEEQAILGHREVNSRRSQHALAQEAGSRDRDSRGDNAGAKTSQRATHHI